MQVLGNDEDLIFIPALQREHEPPELESEEETALTQELEIPEGEDEEENDEEKEADIAEENEDLCPKEEDVEYIQGTPGCKTCRFLVVRKARRFRRARHICRRCYKGHLVSIHSFQTNNRILCSVRGINRGQVWIGAKLKGWFCKRFRWIDGSSWTFSNWAAGQPGRGGGRCVALCTRGGHWRRAPCRRRLPFVCSV
ncbi:proteoglycan 3-like [Monodelphis domestica]|uniref:proteoglycan 3-like n=1 Tax=Monodelphis domestica TaxID=13616 RepID=UPI0024E23CCE|nr:proteoglycan 3-like [Monodelphis domestica]